MAGEANILRIPNFIKARSPKKLRVLMLEKNAQKGLQHDWLKGIVYNPNEDMWYAWYDELIDLNLITGDISSG